LLIGINGVVGAGIFLLPGQVAGLAGAGAVWAYLAAGFVISLIGLSYAEAGAMFDRTGGPVVYAREALGPLAGFSVGWMVWVTYLLGWAILGNGFVTYLASLWPPAEGLKVPIVLAPVALLCALNTLGVRLGSRVIETFTIAKLVPLLVLVVAGLTFAGEPGNAALGLVPEGRGDFLGAVLIITFAYGGFEAATIPAGEMRNPRRTVAVAVLGTISAVTVFYALIQYAALCVVPGLAAATGAEAAAGASAPLATVGEALFAGGLVLMTAGALVSIFGTQSGIALTSPRVPYALAKEGTLPGVFGRVSGRFGTPVVSIWLTGVIVAVLAVTGTFQQLLLLNVAARLYQYLVVCLSVAVLRRRLPDAERPFRLPLGPAIPILAALLCLALLAQQEPPSLLAALAALAVGVALYFATRLTGAGSLR